MCRHALSSTAIIGISVTGTGHNLMPARLIGYARAAVEAPCVDVQEKTLRAAGCTLIFIDELPKRPSQRFKQRAAAIGTLEQGDTFVICSLGLLGRSLPDLVATIWSIICLGCSFRSLAPTLVLHPDGADDGRVVIGALAEAAKAQDAEIFAESEPRRQARRGRRSEVPEKDWPKVVAMAKESGPTRAAEHFGVSRGTIYRIVKQMS